MEKGRHFFDSFPCGALVLILNVLTEVLPDSSQLQLPSGCSEAVHLVLQQFCNNSWTCWVFMSHGTKTILLSLKSDGGQIFHVLGSAETLLQVRVTQECVYLSSPAFSSSSD
ncbi:hypothetical protein ILYODFUR_036412 [Ilyodon furcidens]|uniref:Uncharacterized protein n=1 Tax=Ilyodon furcidens TaxID=33524 RepID=A0ABV0UMC0_9TELE